MDLHALTIQVPSTERLWILPLHLLGVLLLAELKFQHKITSSAADFMCMVATTTARDQSGRHERKDA